MAEFRILSLDGGGSWVLIEVMTLIDLFGGKTAGHDVLRQFDLIAANSGGAIVLGGLAKNMTLSALFDLFADASTNKRGSLFVETSFFSDPADHAARLGGIGARYDTEKKFSG